MGEGWKEKKGGVIASLLFVLEYNLIHNLYYLVGYVMVLACDVINEIAVAGRLLLPLFVLLGR